MAKTDKLIEMANKLLSKNGFSSNGSKREKKTKDQIAFERLIIMTPMGNRMR